MDSGHWGSVCRIRHFTSLLIIGLKVRLIIGDCFSFISVMDSGHWDLFVAYATFLVPSVIASLLIMGLKVRLIIRRVAERNAKLAVVQKHRGEGAKRNLRWLTERFILLRDQQHHEEVKSANRVSLHTSYAYMLLATTEDVPFCVLNTLLLSRAFHDRFDQRFLDQQRLCSPQYGTNFTLILLILLTSVAALVYKVMHLVQLPHLWETQERLLREEARLIERTKMLESSIDLRSQVQASAASDLTTTSELQVLPDEVHAASGLQPAPLVHSALSFQGRLV